jgi:2-polyprenyl-3-methyl-5-hydroxy-6-metoxy-1,4-benzoquinol methylase
MAGPSEGERVASAARWYLEQQLDFDKRLIEFRYRTLKPHLRGPLGLELGSAEGQMTRLLVADFEHLTVVDGAKELLDAIPAFPNVTKVHSLFETFEPIERFQTVVVEHILEHVDDPQLILRRARNWLAREGRLLAGVPNANSIHRRIGVKMGLLAKTTDLTPRDLALDHRRVYTPESFRAELVAADWRVVEFGGVFFKPLSNQQIQDHWSEELKEAFFELGKEFPLHAADIYAVCEVA